MNQTYPDRHHPIYFLQDALEAEGVASAFHRDDQSRGLWGLKVNGQMLVWLIDIRWQHERDSHEDSVRQLMTDGALVMAAQKPDAEYFGCHWLPLAATPGYAPPPNPVKKLTDLAFVGYVRDKPREQALLDLNAHHSISIAQGQFGDAAVSAYHQARLGVNIPTRYGDAQAYDSANMRCFEILATGTPLVTAHEDYLDAMGIVHGKNAFLYHNREHLSHVVATALQRDDLEAVGQAALATVLERHTYLTRASQVMTWLS